MRVHHMNTETFPDVLSKELRAYKQHFLRARLCLNENFA